MRLLLERICLLVLLASLTPMVNADVKVEPGVSLELARLRAEVISQVNYRLQFDIPADPQASIPSRVEITFDLARVDGALQLDFRESPDKLQSLLTNGKSPQYEFIDEHIVIPQAALVPGRNSIAIQFQAGSGSLNRNPGYLYTLFVPDRARTAFPLFDQPDLKARYELTLTVPAGWKALSNAPLAAHTSRGERSEYRFARSDLISSYLFSFVAGEFESVTRMVDGRRMTMLHRETDAEKLARNVDAVFDLHRASLAWLEDYTGIAYPFQKFDFALIPSFQYGGMEHVGAIVYRASRLLLDEAPSERERLQRAELIAHESAHMWFGDLVTMRWFDDVWTKEVFANFMAGKIVNPSFPEVDHDLNFLVSHYPQAYAVDRSEGPNAIRQSLANLNEAGQMYGAIIYHKAPIMMRQLELVLGPVAFQAGVREYLRSFSHGNATWPDLIRILDKKTDADLAAWSDVWVNTSGRPLFKLLESEPAAAQVRDRRLVQVDTAGFDRVWPQRFNVLGRTEGNQLQATIFSGASNEPLPTFCCAGESMTWLYNADSYGYGLFPVDMDIFDAWQSLGQVERGAALINAWENLLSGWGPSAPDYTDLLLGIVRAESNQLLVGIALSQLNFAYHSLLTDIQRAERTAVAEATLWEVMQSKTDSSAKRLFFKAFANLASSSAAVSSLHRVWSGEQPVAGLLLEEDDRIELAEILAIRLPAQSAEIVRQQLATIKNPDSKRRLQFIAPVLSSQVSVRDRFFESLAQERNRHTEAWVADAVALLHHPSRLKSSQRYLQPSLELVSEIQVTGDIFFPSAWLIATLGNHHSVEAAKIVRSFLDQRPAYNDQLRMKILQAADPLFRASRVRYATLRDVEGN